jgi:hypothetical protein
MYGYGLFNDAINILDYMASTSRKVSEKRTGKDELRSGRVLSGDSVQAFAAAVAAAGGPRPQEGMNVELHEFGDSS